MLEFTQWLSLKPLDEDLVDAKRHLGLALVAQGSKESSGMSILPHINSFKDSIERCSNKAGQSSDQALARDLSSIFNSLSHEADEAVSEPDPSMRRYMLSSLLRRMDAEVGKTTVKKSIKDSPLGDLEGRRDAFPDQPEEQKYDSLHRFG